MRKFIWKAHFYAQPKYRKRKQKQQKKTAKFCVMMRTHSNVLYTPSTIADRNRWIGNDPGAKSHFIWAKFTQFKLNAFWFFLLFLQYNKVLVADSKNSVWNNACAEWGTEKNIHTKRTKWSPLWVTHALTSEWTRERERKNKIIQIHESLTWLKSMWQIVIYT